MIAFDAILYRYGDSGFDEADRCARTRGVVAGEIRIEYMEKSLFEIFPDLPWPRPRFSAWRVAGLRRAPTTRVARRRFRIGRAARADESALRNIGRIAQKQYDRLSRAQKASDSGRVLRNITRMAQAALAQWVSE